MCNLSTHPVNMTDHRMQAHQVSFYFSESYRLPAGIQTFIYLKHISFTLNEVYLYMDV